MVNSTSSALKSYQYNDKPTANVQLDRGKESPTALLMQITDWKIDVSTGIAREQCQANVSFLVNDSQLDNQANKQEGYIDIAFGLAKQFISSVLNDPALAVDEDTIDVKSVFMRSDSNRSGVNVQLTISQKQGSCI